MNVCMPVKISADGKKRIQYQVATGFTQQSIGVSEFVQVIILLFTKMITGSAEFHLLDNRIPAGFACLVSWYIFLTTDLPFVTVIS